MFAQQMMNGNGATMTGASPMALLNSMGGGLMPGFNPNDIVKSLATTGSAGTDGSALIGYDLSKLIRVLTLQPENHTPKLQRWETYNAKALSREYNVMTNRGRAKGSTRREGQLGVQDNATYSRNSQPIKFVGRTATVTYELQAAGASSFGDVKAMEVANQLAQMLMDIDRDIWHGNDTLNSLSWKGILQQMDSGSEYKTDLKTTGSAGSRTTITGGGSLDLAQIRQTTPKIIRQGGSFTALYCAPEDKEALGAEHDASSRWYKQDQNSSFAMGMLVDQISQSFGGPIDVITDIWLGGIRGELFPEPLDPSDSDLFHADQPAQPATAPTGALAADGYLPVDEYFYGVAFKNEVGEGPIKIQSTGYTTTNSNGKVNITVTMPSDVSDIKSIVLYRSTTGGAYTNFRRVSETARTAGASATQVIADDGSVVPGSREAVLLDERMVDLGSLANPQAVELARIDLTHRVGLFAMLNTILYGPKFIHRYHNVGGSVTDPTT